MKTSKHNSFRRQVAALILRRSDASTSPEVLLITSRETGRWVIPKGWPMPPKPDSEAAAIEAYEEAGIVGRVEAEPFGAYTYFKRRERNFDLLDVSVFLLHDARQVKAWPEMEERQSEWVAAHEAASRVQEPGLCALISSLASSQREALSRPSSF